MADFWDEQYKDDLKEPFDWFFDFHDKTPDWWESLLSQQWCEAKTCDKIKDDSCGDKTIEMKESIKKKNDVRILMIGCGHSSLSFDLFQSGWTNIISVDSSHEVITAMKAKYPELIWCVGDARDLRTLPEPHGQSHRYDIIIDKGLLDALLVYPKCGEEAAQLAVSEFHRLLKSSSNGQKETEKDERNRSAKEEGKLIIISCLRGPLKDGVSSGGCDGFGGGKVKSLACLEAHNGFVKLTYEELPNPRTPPSPTGLSLGPIAPQFEDICPTHYAVITAINSDSLFERSKSEQTLPPIKAEPASISSSPQSQMSQLSSVASPPYLLHDRVSVFDYRGEPSMVDYDDYYSGAFCSEGETPESHDAFLTFDVLKDIIGQPNWIEGNLGKFRANDVEVDGQFNDVEDDGGDLNVNNGWLSNRGSRLLEVGCGSSAMGMHFHCLGFDYLGTDAIPSAIQTQRVRYPQLRLEIADARSLTRDLRGVGASVDWLAKPVDWLAKPVDIVFDKVCVLIKMHNF